MLTPIVLGHILQFSLYVQVPVLFFKRFVLRNNKEILSVLLVIQIVHCLGYKNE